MRQKKGFTLIEVIFVLAILGVAMTLGLSYTAKLAERTKEKTTALQIQQILQAAMTFYVEKNTWPIAGRSEKGSTVDDFTGGYIPAASRLETNPWGMNGYSWAPTIDNRLFSVSTSVPSSDVAARVAAMLPNAIYDASVVTAQITIPGQAQEVRRSFVMKTGDFPALDVSVDHVHGELVAVSSVEVAACESWGGTVKVMPSMNFFQVTASIRSSYGDYTATFDVHADRCSANNSEYCVYYGFMGERMQATGLYPDNVKISYVALCMVAFPG